MAEEKYVPKLAPPEHVSVVTMEQLQAALEDVQALGERAITAAYAAGGCWGDDKPTSSQYVVASTRATRAFKAAADTLRADVAAAMHRGPLKPAPCKECGCAAAH